MAIFSKWMQSFSRNAKVLQASAMFLGGTQKFWERTQSFLGGRKSFGSKHKVSWENDNSKVLRANTKFLGGEANVLGANTKFLGKMTIAKFWERTQSLLGVGKSFWSEHNVSWENDNSKVLRANTKFIGGRQKFWERTPCFLGKWQ